MKKNMKKALAIGLCAVMGAATMSACGTNNLDFAPENLVPVKGGETDVGTFDPEKGMSGGVYNYEKESDSMVKFSSSDEKMDFFLNDYFNRHLRYDENSIGPVPVGDSVMFNKEWEALSLMWFDSTATNIANDRYKMMRAWIEQIPVDRFGYVWADKGNVKPATSGSLQFFGQGWLFPTYEYSNGHSIGFEWNNDQKGADGWKVSNTTLKDGTFVPADKKMSATVKNGLYSASVKGGKLVTFESPELSAEPFHAPFVELDTRIFSNGKFGHDSDIEDVFFQWKTSDSDVWDAKKTVSYKTFATRPPQSVSAIFNQLAYFPMYLHPYWNAPEESGGVDGRRITQLRVVVAAKDGVTDLNANVDLNCVRLNYDTRQTNNAELLITAAKQYFEFTGDVAFLKQAMPRLRAATLFLLEHAKGRDGFIDNSYFIGHDGVGMKTGHGIGNGYYDISALPTRNIYTDTYFYSALTNMAWLEGMAEETAIAFTPTAVDAPYLKNADGTLAVDKITYAETEKSLLEIAGTVKQNTQDYYWIESTGRFGVGISPETAGGFEKGEMLDFGHIVFNMDAVARGVASDAQSKSILSWMDGTRTVAGDDSTAEDIYKFEFAPRVTTRRNSHFYVWTWIPKPYGQQLQDGGATLYTSFYDLISRIKVLGADNAYSRLKKIQSWYDPIYEYSVANEVTGYEFYREYYYSQRPDITLQGNTGGGDSDGSIGVDAEFIESSLLAAAVPFGFFGLDSDAYRTLSVKPSLPTDKNFRYSKIENLSFQGNIYDLSVGRNWVQIDSVRGGELGNFVKAVIKAPEKVFEVKVNGVTIPASEYTVADGYVTVRAAMPHAEARLTVTVV